MGIYNWVRSRPLNLRPWAGTDGESVLNSAVKQKKKRSEAIKMHVAVDGPGGNPGSDCSVYLLHSAALLEESDAD